MPHEPLRARRTNKFPAFARDWIASLRNGEQRAEQARELERRILIVNGHPDPRPERFCAALCDAYETGAQSGAWETRRLDVGTLALCEPGAGSKPSLAGALQAIGWANRLVIVFPLWLDRPPERLRLLFDQMAFTQSGERAARIVVTMEMPAFAHRATFQPARIESDQARIMTLPGIKASKPVFIGCVGTISSDQRRDWLANVRGLGILGL